MARKKQKRSKTIRERNNKIDSFPKQVYPNKISSRIKQYQIVLIIIGIISALFGSVVAVLQIFDWTDAVKSRYFQVLSIPVPGRMGKKEALEYIGGGKRFFSEKVLNGLDLSKKYNNGSVDLIDLDLTFVNIFNTKFQGANIAGSKFGCDRNPFLNLFYGSWANKSTMGCVNLTNVNFSGANLSDSEFIGANLKDTSFGCIDNKDCVSADNSIFFSSSFLRVDFSGSYLEGIKFRCFRKDIGLDDSCSFFWDSDFSGANLTSAEIKNSYFANTVFSCIRDKEKNSSEKCTDLEGANLMNSRFFNCDFSGADLRLAQLQNANFYPVSKELQTGGGKISIAPSRGSKFSKVTSSIKGADLLCADLRGVSGLTCDELKYAYNWKKLSVIRIYPVEKMY